MQIIFSLILLTTILAPNFTSKNLDQKQAKENKRIEIAEWKTYLTGRFDPATHEDFVAVPKRYSLGPNMMYLRKETYDAFLKMREEAVKSGITLNLASATRNFDYQKGIWETKWLNTYANTADPMERFEKILEYSAAPGTSRHHFGTDIDINGADPAYFETEEGAKVYEWLTENAPLFGFCQTYNEKGAGRTTGHSEEKWHWSYTPLARNFTQEYKRLVKNEDIKGFLGNEYVQNLNLINDYVLSIN